MRLTEKVENYTEPYERRKDIGLWDIFTKLGQLEDIEDKLGIDLVTLYKIISDGFFVKRISRIAWVMPGEFMLYKDGMSEGWECPTKLFFKDYGKTWALTKEELEK